MPTSRQSAKKLYCKSMSIKNQFNYFSDEEIKGLDTELVAMLDVARHKAGIPFVITDGLRTPATNTDPNAVKDSAHLKGLAVDLRCRDYQSLWKILDGLFSSGFKRMGIYFRKVEGKTVPTHIHCDIAKDGKPQEVLWITGEI